VPLQAESETAQAAEAAMKPSKLRELARDQLVESGYAPDDADRIAQELVDAATKRLVLLVPRDDGIGFEIRSLQELMAARALTEGEDAAVLGRLRLIAHSPHWRNTWLLAAGHLLRSERFERSIIQLLRRLDDEPRRLGARYPTAPLLAADLLEDNLAVSRPNFERALMNRLFTVLDRPPVVGLGQAAKAFLALARTPHRTAPHRATVFERLGATASASMATRAAASVILRQMATMTDDNRPLTSIRLIADRIALSAVEDRAVTEWMSVDLNALYRRRAHSRARTKMADYLGSLVDATGLDAPHLEVLRQGLHTAADASFETIKDEHV